MKYKYQQGFTLLEVIIALVVLSAALIPLFMLFSSHLDAMQRLSAENERAAATSTILNFMETVNPVESPTGEGEGGGYLYKWSTTPLLELEKKPKGNFQIGLYEATINVERVKDQPWFDFKVRLTGFEKVKETGSRLPPPLPGENEEPDNAGRKPTAEKGRDAR